MALSRLLFECAGNYRRVLGNTAIYCEYRITFEMLYIEMRNAIKRVSVTTYMLKARPELTDFGTEGYRFEPCRVY